MQETKQRKTVSPIQFAIDSPKTQAEDKVRETRFSVSIDAIIKLMELHDKPSQRVKVVELMLEQNRTRKIRVSETLKILGRLSCPLRVHIMPKLLANYQQLTIEQGWHLLGTLHKDQDQLNVLQKHILPRIKKDSQVPSDAVLAMIMGHKTVQHRVRLATEFKMTEHCERLHKDLALVLGDEKERSKHTFHDEARLIHKDGVANVFVMGKLPIQVACNQVESIQAVDVSAGADDVKQTLFKDANGMSIAMFQHEPNFRMIPLITEAKCTYSVACSARDACGYQCIEVRIYDETEQVKKRVVFRVCV